jgi:hypothetical protein
VGGVSLHANVAVPAGDRRRLERLCRYVARPPLATERLARLPDGRLLYRLKHRWRDGTRQVVFDSLELVGKLASLVPPPRFHLVRYHGVFAPCASARDRVVPGAADAVAAHRPDAIDAAGDSPGNGAPAAEAGAGSALEPLGTAGLPARSAIRGTAEPSPEIGNDAACAAPPRPRRLSWSELMRRVFAIDVLECPRCRGAMRILAVIHPPDTTAAILACLNLPTRAPPTEPASPEEEPVDSH